MTTKDKNNNQSSQERVVEQATAARQQTSAGNDSANNEDGDSKTSCDHQTDGDAHCCGTGAPTTGEQSYDYQQALAYDQALAGREADGGESLLAGHTRDRNAGAVDNVQVPTENSCCHD